MPIIPYDVHCPVCGKEVVIRRSSASPAPLYCGQPCAYAARSGKRTPQKYHFDASMDLAILRAARGKTGGLARLWRTDRRFARAGIPYPIVKRHAWLLGAVRSFPNDIWSAEEEAYCVQQWHKGRPADTIARSMRQRGWRRSPGAIVHRMRIHHLTQRQGACLSLSEVAQGLGVDSHTVTRWIARHGLPEQRQPGQRTLRLIDQQALRKWILAHPELVARVAAPDYVWFIALLVPPQIGHTTADVHEEDDTEGHWLGVAG